MRIFVTGASGWIGSAVVPQLVGPAIRWGAGPLNDSARAFTAAGAEPHRGTLMISISLRRAAGRPTASSTWPSSMTSPSPGTSRAPAKRTAGPSRPSARCSRLGPAPRYRFGDPGVLPGQVATQRDGHGSDPATAAFSSGPWPGGRRLSSRSPSPRTAFGLQWCDPANEPRQGRQRFHGRSGRHRPPGRGAPATSAQGPIAGRPCT